MARMRAGGRAGSDGRIIPMRTLTIAHRFRGPTTSANGGYMCGRIAALLDAPVVTVRLLAPPPLDVELSAAMRHGRLEVRRDETPIAEARAGDLGDIEPPPPPTYSEAVAAAARYAGFTKHPARECFVCGPTRGAGDGLRIFCGPLEHAADLAAGPWQPDDTLAAGDGRVAPEIVWAALDCPGFHAVAPDMRMMLLGELTARVDRRVEVGERCTVVGWKIGSSGRKHEAGTALYGAAGDVCGLGRAIWIEPRRAAQAS